MIYRSSYDPISKEILHDYLDTRFFIEEKSKYCESIFEGSDIVLEDGEKKNIFEKIGQAILDIIKKIGDFINKMIDKVSGMSLAGKSEIIKAEKLIKRHPEFKDQIMEALQSGSIDLNDIKNVQELDEAATRIVQLGSEMKYDPNNKLDAMWAKAKAKYHKFKNTKNKTRDFLSVAGSAVSLATGALTLATTITLFKTRTEKEKLDLQKLKDSNNEKNALIKQLLDAMERVEDKTDRNTRSIDSMKQSHMIDMAQMAGVIKSLKDVVSENSKIVTETISKHTQETNSMLSAISAAVTRFENKLSRIRKNKE